MPLISRELLVGAALDDVSLFYDYYLPPTVRRLWEITIIVLLP